MDSPILHLTILAVGVLVYALVLSILRTLAARVALAVNRHDLLVESRHRRIAFYQEQEALRSGEVVGDVIIEDEASDVIIEPDPPMTLKAAA